MPKFSRILKVLIDKGTDLVFEHISTSSKEKTVTLPPRLREFESGAAELLARSEELLEGVTESLGAPETSLTSETETSKRLDYCLECCDKHFGGSSKLSEEAIMFYDRSGGMTEDVQAKVSAIVDELAGLHDDIKPGSPSEVMNLLHGADRVRKDIWKKKLEIGSGTRDDLLMLKRDIDALKQQTLEIAKQPTINECRRWNIPEEHVAECSRMLSQYKDKEISPEEFARGLQKWTGTEYEVVHTGEKIQIKPKGLLKRVES